MSAGRWLVALLAPALPLVADELGQEAYGILKKNCFACHGVAKTAGLDMRTREGMIAGGQRGPAIVPNNVRRSLLYKFASHEEQPAMPPGKKLSDAELNTIREWILAGASLDGIAEAAKPDDEKRKAEMTKLEERPITAEERAFWAFQAPRRAELPKVANAVWSRNPVDVFLLSAMTAKGLKPMPPASKRTLVRRAFLDLLGLPPTPDEVAAFVNDKSPDAWPKLIEKLLASPHYGERWARHWLDLVRYADSGGFEFDVERPDGYRYRDYVVKAFNEDKPYDRFIKEQLAGDEIAAENNDAMTATGFLRLGPEGGGGGELGRQESLDDIIATTSLTFLGLTVNCARCHNHKFDPIPQKDYYRIQSVFASTRPVSHPLVTAEVVEAQRKDTARIEALTRPIRQEKTKLEEPYKKRLTDEAIAKLPEYMQLAWNTPADKRTEGQRLNVRQIERTLQANELSKKLTEAHIVAIMTDEHKAKHAELTEQIAAINKQRPKPFDTARAIGENGRQPRTTYFLHRGAVDSRGSAMNPGVLSVAFDGEWEFPAPPPDAKSSWRRRGFAEWVASPVNPLTARVMVNRMWQHHFGEGIVRTPSNFGKMGEPPSHPELLDWLALEFIDKGWSMKAMHRLMMNSQAYQMSSDDLASNLEKDPENRMFWRMPRQRLEAEAIRDSILTAAGTLDRTLGGPCILPYINPVLFQSSTNRTWRGKPDDDPSTWRRSLYVFSKRSIRYPMFETFDQPNLVNSCDRRNRSTIAPQALLLMNNNFVLVQAKMFGERIAKEAGTDPRAQVERAWGLALGRSPDDKERAEAIAFLKSAKDGLAGLAHALFNLNEFVYRQ